MALTTNYSWDKPTPSGDVGSWGTKANTIFDSIDSQVKTVETAAAAADAKALVAQVDIQEMAGQMLLGNLIQPMTTGSVNLLGFDGGLAMSSLAGAMDEYGVLPLGFLPPGIRITGVDVFLTTLANTTITLSLHAKDTAGAVTAPWAGFVSTNEGTNFLKSTSGLSIDVVATKMYYLHIRWQRTSGSNQANISFVRLTVSRP